MSQQTTIKIPVWDLDVPTPFELQHPGPRYGIILVMSRDSSTEDWVEEDLWELRTGLPENAAALILLCKDGQATLVEASAGKIHSPAAFLDFTVGDPRDIGRFLGRALSSFPREAMTAVGFWGHGRGVFGEHDPSEIRLHANGDIVEPLP